MDVKEREARNARALRDYQNGLTYKMIAEKYDVSMSTVKSWKTRYGWKRKLPKLSVCKSKVAEGMQTYGKTRLYEEIREDMIQQLKENNCERKHYIDLVDDYMSLWEIKNNLIKDIRIRGVSVEWKNGKQKGMKKNDSIPELNKTSAQMLKILNDLGLKPSPKIEDDDEEI